LPAAQAGAYVKPAGTDAGRFGGAEVRCAADHPSGQTGLRMPHLMLLLAFSLLALVATCALVG
jgi:hypothetical protein